MSNTSLGSLGTAAQIFNEERLQRELALRDAQSQILQAQTIASASTGLDQTQISLDQRRICGLSAMNQEGGSPSFCVLEP